jgi:NAD+ synthase (glutamine-hydrolysing)
MESTVLATCSLNQWALDFAGNLERILDSIVTAKRIHRARIRVGPELEVTGYSCEDHFLEPDTVHHAWQTVAQVLRLTQVPPYNDILVTLSMPVNCRGVLYNCSLVIYNSKILLIKPKTVLADDGNYRESRWFKPWSNGNTLLEYVLPDEITRLTGQVSTHFGVALLRSADGYLIGLENCEELWSPLNLSTKMYLQGAHVVLNPSGSHFTMRKLATRVSLIKSATVKTGGVYLYSNQIGCDGNRLYFDGCSSIAINGEIVALGKQFSVDEVEVVSACLHLSEVTSYRSYLQSTTLQASESLTDAFTVIGVPGFRLVTNKEASTANPPISLKYPTPEEEIAQGPACYLWDYLRRSKASGFFLPLSGGADSSAVLSIVGNMCRIVVSRLQECGLNFNYRVLHTDLMRILGFIPQTAEEMAKHIMYAAYLASPNSSADTRRRAKTLAEQVGCTFYEADIDEIFHAFTKAFQLMTGSEKPKFKVEGGTWAQDLALQNIQARVRMVLSYLSGQLIPWHLGKEGFLVILGSSVLDESLTGYLTKYDCSSADINPIGSISKQDLKKFLGWAAENLNYSILSETLAAPPTAELTPLSSSGEVSQTDEDDMGLTYEEIGIMGRLRKIQHCGPLFMFLKLCTIWSWPKSRVAEKVKRFFALYSRNRHKMTVITPAVYIESYSCDDNRFDLRQFLYNTAWTTQFQEIDRLCTS